MSTGKSKGMEHCIRRMAQWINEEGGGDVSLTIKMKWDKARGKAEIIYDKDQAGLLLGMVASDELLANIATAGLVKILADMDEEESLQVLKSIADTVCEAREAMGGDAGVLRFSEAMLRRDGTVN